MDIQEGIRNFHHISIEATLSNLKSGLEPHCVRHMTNPRALLQLRVYLRADLDHGEDAPGHQQPCARTKKHERSFEKPGANK